MEMYNIIHCMSSNFTGLSDFTYKSSNIVTMVPPCVHIEKMYAGRRDVRGL